ncbi:M23 family metallopeptidase [Candidatus Acetothermia bacterium]|nr:M23 family metallopeptidase [Candidatus Acetothermia bacterium]MBI3660790.1 M23 family metallopeptidase [Candidatus Acetothermia bacterium]
MSRGAFPRRLRRRWPLRLVFAVGFLIVVGMASWVYFQGESLFGDVAAKLRGQGGPTLDDPARSASLDHTPQIVSYEIQPGDTFASVAKQLRVPSEAILSSNEFSELVPGKTLRILREGVLHKIKSRQTLTDIARTYGVSIEEIVQFNSQIEPDRLFAGHEIFVPHAKNFPKAKAYELAKGKTSGFVWPLFGELSSFFGPRIHPVTGKNDFHEGLDIEVPEGTSVYASQAGRVVWAGKNGGYGFEVIIDHGNGYRTGYGHLSELKVYRGQFVEGGQLIALSGNTGLSTGPHLHFEIRQYGRALNPLAILP